MLLGSFYMWQPGEPLLCKADESDVFCPGPCCGFLLHGKLIVTLKGQSQPSPPLLSYFIFHLPPDSPYTLCTIHTAPCSFSYIKGIIFHGATTVLPAWFPVLCSMLFSKTTQLLLTLCPGVASNGTLAVRSSPCLKGWWL